MLYTHKQSQRKTSERVSRAGISEGEKIRSRIDSDSAGGIGDSMETQERGKSSGLREMVHRISGGVIGVSSSERVRQVSGFTQFTPFINTG